MSFFDHEKLNVYQLSIDLVVLADEVVEHLPKGRAYLADQLQRATTSVPLNIAEGAGEYSGQEKNRFYRMAKRSATECAAIFDVCQRLRLVEKSQYEKAREILVHVVNILTKLAKTAR
jgi:four helix bundle protein